MVKATLVVKLALESLEVQKLLDSVGEIRRARRRILVLVGLCWNRGVASTDWE